MKSPLRSPLESEVVDTGSHTFVALLGLSKVDLGDGFEVDVPQSDAAVPSSRGEAFFTRVHAEDPRLNNR